MAEPKKDNTSAPSGDPKKDTKSIPVSSNSEAAPKPVQPTDQAKSTPAPKVSPVVAAAAAEENIGTPAPPNYQPNVYHSGSAGHGFGKVIGGVLLLAVAAGAVYFVYNYTKPKNANQAATVTKKDVAVLNVGVVEPLPHTYYPDIENDSLALDINSQIFEGLTAFDQDTKIGPRLAESWTNPDDSTWVFKLRKGVKFHTGTVMTAKHVKASIEGSQKYSIGQQFGSTIKSVEVVDDNTVKITTNGPDPLLANELANLYIYDTDSAKKNDAITGSGPYNLKEDGNVIKLTAFDGYYGGHVYSREVDYYSFADDDALLKASEQHSIDIAVGSGDIADNAAKNGFDKTAVAEYSTAHFVFNTLRKNSPLAKVAVRQALALATNVPALTALRGVDAQPASQTIPTGIPGHNPDLKAIAFDQAKAKSMLVAAGYPKGFTIVLTYFPKNQPLAEELKKEYAAVGVTLTLDPESDQQTLVKKAIGGGTDMYYNIVTSSVVDGSDILADFVDAPNYNNPAVTKLSGQAASTLDSSKRIDLLQQMSKLLVADQADIPVYENPGSSLIFKSGLVVKRDTSANIIGTYFWKVYQK